MSGWSGSLSNRRGVRRGGRAWFLMFLACGIRLAHAQTAAVPAQELIKSVISNELADRQQPQRCRYLIEKKQGAQTITEDQVESRDGPVYRMVAIDHHPLAAEQKKQEDDRLAALLRDPGQQSRSKRQYEADEQQLERLMRLMPDAFLFDYAGHDGELLRLNFHPNPQFQPPTYEARVLHSLAGSVLVDAKQKRLARLSGELIEKVQFGLGLLGHIDKGGAFEFGRVQVDAKHWKTNFVRIELSGRIVFFKTVSKSENETRSAFRPVSNDLSISQAVALLSQPE